MDSEVASIRLLDDFGRVAGTPNVKLAKKYPCRAFAMRPYHDIASPLSTPSRLPRAQLQEESCKGSMEQSSLMIRTAAFVCSYNQTLLASMPCAAHLPPMLLLQKKIKFFFGMK